MYLKTRKEQIELVQQSFQEVLIDGEIFIDRFYATMFEMYPDTQHYFAETDMPVLRKKVLASLMMIIDHLSNPERLSGELRRLGIEHSEDHDIGASDYTKMGKALIKAIAVTIPKSWNPVVETAWISAFGDVTMVMLSEV